MLVDPTLQTQTENPFVATTAIDPAIQTMAATSTPVTTAVPVAPAAPSWRDALKPGWTLPADQAAQLAQRPGMGWLQGLQGQGLPNVFAMLQQQMPDLFGRLMNSQAASRLGLTPQGTAANPNADIGRFGPRMLQPAAPTQPAGTQQFGPPMPMGGSDAGRRWGGGLERVAPNPLDRGF